MSKFKIETVQNHIRKKHPLCPDFAVEFFAAEVARKYWKGASIGMAVGITMQNIIRHQMTDYDQLLLAGVAHEEARRRVRSRVNAMIDSWSKPKVK